MTRLVINIRKKANKMAAEAETAWAAVYREVSRKTAMEESMWKAAVQAAARWAVTAEQEAKELHAIADKAEQEAKELHAIADKAEQEAEDETWSEFCEIHDLTHLDQKPERKENGTRDKGQS